MNAARRYEADLPLSLDDPDRINASEHAGECNAGMGVPWGSGPPPMPIPRAWRQYQEIREARKARKTGSQ